MVVDEISVKKVYISLQGGGIHIFYPEPVQTRNILYTLLVFSSYLS